MEIAETISSVRQQRVLVLDPAFQPVFANPALHTMFEISSIDLEGEVIHACIWGDARKPRMHGSTQSCHKRAFCLPLSPAIGSGDPRSANRAME